MQLQKKERCTTARVLQFNLSSVVVQLCEAIDGVVRGRVGGFVVTGGVNRIRSTDGSDAHKHRRHFVPSIADYGLLSWLRTRL